MEQHTYTSVQPIPFYNRPIRYKWLTMYLILFVSAVARCMTFSLHPSESLFCLISMFLLGDMFSSVQREVSYFIQKRRRLRDGGSK